MWFNSLWIPVYKLLFDTAILNDTILIQFNKSNI